MGTAVPVKAQLKEVDTIYSTDDDIFAAKLYNGNVVTWGGYGVCFFPQEVSENFQNPLI